MKNMTQEKPSTKILAEHNRLAAQAILPHFAAFGLHYLADRAAIRNWCHSHPASGFSDADLPATVNWAVGIDRCSHLRLVDNSFEAGAEVGQPGLFSLSINGSFLQWRPGSKRPARLLGQPVQTAMHFLQFLTQNSAHPDCPVFTQMFTPYSEEFCQNWSIDQATPRG